jgi:hypothetical protein
MNFTGLIAKVLRGVMSLKIFILSPLERTLALREGFQPLPDYRFNVLADTKGILECPYRDIEKLTFSRRLLPA